MKLNMRETIRIDLDGEEVTVHNDAALKRRFRVSGGNPESEEFDSIIEHFENPGEKIDYVTEWCADSLWHNHGIDLRTDDHDIQVIDEETLEERKI